MAKPLTKIEIYRQQMLIRKAKAAGCSVEELLARSEADRDRNYAMIRAENKARSDHDYCVSVMIRGVRDRGNWITWLTF